MPDEPDAGPLQSVRASVVGAVGPRAVHAAEDGLTAGALVGLSVTTPAIAGILAGVLGASTSRAGPLALLRELPQIIRTDDARSQESYFVVAFLVGAGASAVVGSVLPPL